MTKTMLPAALGIDPGNIESATALFDPNTGGVSHLAKIPNHDVFDQLTAMVDYAFQNVSGQLVIGIEQIRSYGMAVGATVFDTVHWSGRFHQYLYDTYGELEKQDSIYLMPRKDVKMHLCMNNRAKDTNVNQAIADRWGGMKACKGTKKSPGPLYGIAGDMWAALGVALTLGDNLIDGRYVEGSAGRLL